MTEYSPAVDELLADSREPDLGAGVPVASAIAKLKTLTLEELFAPHAIRDGDAARACLAGLHLWFDDLDGSHRISQELHTPEGSAWHGIMHRREGDFWNAKYWFRRAGPHPAFDDWDPMAFVDRVEKASGADAAECRRLQAKEWQMLFDFCWRGAVG